MGIPKISFSQGSPLRFGCSGTGQRPALQIMMSDAFIGNKHGLSENGPDLIRETFGENTSFFICQVKEGWTWILIGNIYHLFIPTEWCNTERLKEHFFMM